MNTMLVLPLQLRAVDGAAVLARLQGVAILSNVPGDPAPRSRHAPARVHTVIMIRPSSITSVILTPVEAERSPGIVCRPCTSSLVTF